LVITLIQHFKRQGLQVGVVSRGYGRQGSTCLEVLPSTPILESGDEPALIFRQQATPVFIAKKRTDAVRALLEKYPATQVIVSDDGLQHHSMARDIEITVFDDRGIGNGWLLPAGPLREFLSSRPRLVLHTGQSPAFKGFKSTRRLADHALNAAGHRVSLSGLNGQAITALAGIANPDAFFNMLTARGLRLQQTISLPDHFDFSDYAWPASEDAVVLCTEKDAIKMFTLTQFKGYDLLAVPLEFSPEPAFLVAIDTLLARLFTKSSELPSVHGH
jgi:tetraacyldisaccharide 4'-kinase